MRKIFNLLLLALICLYATAQNVERVFDMDKLIASNGFLLSQNNPNSFNGTTDVYLAVLEDKDVTLTIADIYGHVDAMYSASLESGIHQFRITLSAKGTYLMGAHQNGRKSSIVMLCNEGGSCNNIEYIGFVEPIDKSLFNQIVNTDGEEDFIGYGAVQSAKTADLDVNNPFRVALSLSPFTLKQFELGYSFQVGDKKATTPVELQQIYKPIDASPCGWNCMVWPTMLATLLKRPSSRRFMECSIRLWTGLSPSTK